jgi:hypothetical protein
VLELQHVSHGDLGEGVGRTFYDARAVGVGVLEDDSSSAKTEESKEHFVFFFKLFSEIRETDSLGSETEC